MFSQALLAATAFSFIPAATAHMIMAHPIPFAGMDNSPLNNAAPGSSGSNFPCKIPAGGKYTVQTMNSITVDTPTDLSFTGSAVHGGGSCQVSVTMDKEPTVNSQWKVVHSIVGGCPSSAEGNLPADPNGGGASKFQFSLPKGMPNGEYTLAWTWFNKVGNREMYMNCAPISVSGGADDTKALEALPDMFVMNLPRESCKAPEGGDLSFPNPGTSVNQLVKNNLVTTFEGSGCDAMEKLGAGSGTPATPAPATGGSGSGSGSNSGAASSAVAAPSAGSGASSAAAPAASSANNGQYTGEGASKPTNKGGAFAPGASSAAASSPTATSLVTVVQPTTAAAAPTSAAAAPVASSAPAAAVPANGSSGSSGSCAAGATACSNDGGVVCLPGNKWGLCDRGCVVPQLMAAGMGCDAGVMKAVVSRRSRVARHAHAHRGGLGGVF